MTSLSDALCTTRAIRRRYCAFDVPSRTYSSRQNPRNNPSLFSNHGSRASIGKPQCVALIQCLIAHRSPFAIGWAVRAIIVVSFNRKIVPIASVDSPRFEGEIVAPLIANDNPSTAVIVETRVSRRKAAGAHCSPDAIKPRAVVAVPSSPFGHRFPVIASTRNRFALPKASPQDRSLSTAVTYSDPHRSSVLGACALGNTQSPKRFANHVFEGIRHDAP